MSVHGPSGRNFERPKVPNKDFDADPDPIRHSEADPDEFFFNYAVPNLHHSLYWYRLPIVLFTTYHKFRTLKSIKSSF